MEKPQDRKDLENLNAINDELALAVSRTTVMLFEEYKRSPEFVEHEKTGTTLSSMSIRDLAKDRVGNDWLVAKIVLSQEGSIPPRNAFHGKDEVVRSSMLLDGDKRDLGQLNRGYAHLCIHGSIGDGIPDEMLDKLGESLDRLKTAITGRMGQGG